MVFLVIVAALVVGGSTAYVTSGEVRYLWRAAAEEAAILHASRSIDEILRDSALGGEHRGQLELVHAARDYAARIGYEAKDTYRKYADVGRDTLLLVVSASGRHCICPVVWTYPIVGRVPYKGFFVAKDAEKEGRRLADKGYDVYLRTSGAFSTLGWFEDPLLSTAMSRDSVELAALVFHEIAHNSLYVKSATPFNESFAQFAGYRAAERFFRDRGDSALAQKAADRWHDEMILGEYYHELVDRATAFYQTNPDSAALEAGRLELGRWVKQQAEGWLKDSLRSVRLQTPVPERPINNARLVGITIYRTRLALFQRWYDLHDQDIERSVRELRKLEEGAEGDEAFERLERAVGEAVAPPG